MSKHSARGRRQPIPKDYRHATHPHRSGERASGGLLDHCLGKLGALVSAASVGLILFAALVGTSRTR